MWEKLAWDVDQYQDIQRSHPREKQPLAFAAINVCIAAWSLGQWVKCAWKQERRLAGEKANDKLFYDLIQRLVPAQAICASVANTAKHAAHQDQEGWEGGEVRLDWEDGDENIPPTFVLRHVDSNQMKMEAAYSTFEAVRNDWWTCLVTLGFASGTQRSPEFMQNKLRRIFGGTIHPLPPGASAAEKPISDVEVG